MGILPLLPTLTSGMSAPRMQYASWVLLPVSVSLPQSPPIVADMTSLKVPFLQPSGFTPPNGSKSTNQLLKMACAICSK